MRKCSTLSTICALAFLPYFGLTTIAGAQDDSVAKFFAGKQIAVITGFPPGGGFDIYARLVARYIGAYIPGHPNIVSQNMPGAGGMTLVANFTSAAVRDGTVIGAIHPNNISARLLADMTEPRYDAQKLVFVGSPDNDLPMCYVRTDAEVKTFNDLFTKTLIVGATAPFNYSFDYPNAENAILGTKFKVVTGYLATPDILVAMERNEVQGFCGIDDSVILGVRPKWVSSGFAKVLVQESSTGSGIYNSAGVPRTVDFAKTPDDRAALDLIYGIEQFGRPLVLPPGVPQARVDALRHAFDEVMKDKQLLADAETQHLDINVESGEHLQTAMEQLYKTPPEVIQRAKAALALTLQNK